MAHAAESTHYYSRDGKPAYTVKAKAGHDRPTTVADARKLGLVPSVTTVIRCAAAPGLEYWKTQQAILAALTLPKVDGEAEDAYLSRILSDSKEQARKAAERGTAIHAALQDSYERGFPEEEFIPYVQGASSELLTWSKLPHMAWTAERAFAHPLGFGGKVDLSCDGFGVADFKTKEFDEETAKTLKTWDEHAMQLAAYRHGLGMDKARCAIVYVSTTQPGLAKLIEIPEEELQKGWKCFYSLLHFWQAKNGYVSAFEKALAA
jgi:hypothetical protein